MPATDLAPMPVQKRLTHPRQVSDAANVFGVERMLPLLSRLDDKLTSFKNVPDCWSDNNFVRLGILFGPVLLDLILPSTFLSWLYTCIRSRTRQEADEIVSMSPASFSTRLIMCFALPDIYPGFVFFQERWAWFSGVPRQRYCCRV